MKKLIFSMILAGCLSLTGVAQTVTTSPSSFTALDAVTITIDVTGTGAEGLAEAYIWGWAPGIGDWPTNGVWSESSENAKLTSVSENVWQFSLPIEIDGVTYNNFSEFLGVPPGQIDQIGMLVKEKVGNDATKTPDILLDVEPLTFTPRQLRSFPSVVRNTDVVTLYLDTNAPDLTVPALKGLKEATLWVEDPQSGEQISFPAREEQPGVWGVSLFPVKVFGEEVERINFWFEDPKHPGLMSDTDELRFVQ